jgi:hypothetical protein
LSARIESEGNFILALSILLTIFTEFPNTVIAWNTIDFARLVLPTSENFGEQLAHSIQRPDKDWERSVFLDSDRSECTALALLVFSLSLAMNKAVDCEHFRAVLKICRNQIEFPIEPLMAAACNLMLDIVKMSIKFSVPLNALIRPMLTALTASAGRAPTAVVALPTITFKIALPVPNLIKICEILLGAFETADNWEDEAPFLLVRIIRMTADAVSIEFAELTMRADPAIAIEMERQLLFAISCYILCLPTAFAN